MELKFEMTEDQAIKVQEMLNMFANLLSDARCWRDGTIDDSDLEYVIEKLDRFNMVEVCKFINELGMEVEDL